MVWSLNKPAGVSAPQELLAGQPYCGACGYSLVGATESARCPECGEAIVDVMQRKGREPTLRGRRWRSQATMFGVPVIAIAFGPDALTGERIGKPRGVIALGDQPMGGIAVGGLPVGVVAVGGLSVGVCSVGGLALGAIASIGGMAVSAGMSVGGGVVGLLAAGGGAIGYFARGGAAVGRYAWGGAASGQHTITHVSSDPVATKAFADAAWFFGTTVASPRPMLVTVGTIAVFALIIGALAWLRMCRSGADPRDPFRHEARNA